MRRVLFLLAVVGCSSPQSSSPTPIARTRTEATTPVAPAHDAPSEPECDALLTHALGITLATIQPPPAEADRVALRGELRGAFIADCRAGTRVYHQCGLAAKTVADLQACKR